MGTVTIVGAGINGLMCAYWLVRRGLRVKVVDQGPIPNPTSASFGLHRLIHPWTKNGSVTTALEAIASLKLWKEVLEDLKSPGFKQTGVVAIDRFRMFVGRNLPTAIRRLDCIDLEEALPFGKVPTNWTGVLFADFGCLYASRILHDLHLNLKGRGVVFQANANASIIEPETGNVFLSNGELLTADYVVLAAGTGTGKILAQSRTIGSISFSTERCYVAYVSERDNAQRSHKSCWSSLGLGDFWGMPAMDGHKMKLGSGRFTQAITTEHFDDSGEIAQKIFDQYKEMFPMMADRELVLGAHNHWTLISAPRGSIKRARLTVITSDNGGGFKFAPLVAWRAVKKMVR